MTLKEIDNKLKKIKRELNSIETEIILRTKSKHFNSTINQDFLKEWKEIAKEINAKWDNVSVEEEMKYQREKGD